MYLPTAVFLVVLGLGVFAGMPGSAHAQHRIAYLTSDVACDAPAAFNTGLRAFIAGLEALGYREGQAVIVECHSAEGRYERLDALAIALVERKPDVLVAAAAPASLAAKRATSRLPIVSVYAADPVRLGLVASLARPGGNVTGISSLSSDYAAKTLQLLKETAPRTTRVGVLGHVANPTYAIYRQELEAASRLLGIPVAFGPVRESADVATQLADMRRRGADAFLVMHQPFTFVHREAIVNAVAATKLPAMYGSPEAVEAGGLAAYAVNVADVFRRSAQFVDHILRGARPADMPFEQPTSFEFAINLATARTLGLAIPPQLLHRAARVVE